MAPAAERPWPGGAGPAPGMVWVTAPGVAQAAAGRAEAAAVAAILRGGETLHGWASRQPGRRALQGRGVAWAAALPGGPRVVVRHSRHGGLLAPLTGDRFVAPTRAPHEARVATALAADGLAPRVVAFAVHPAGPLLRRADVATEEVPDARDLADWLADGRPLADALPAVETLLRALRDHRVHHPDLNLKNVLLSHTASSAARAWLLDVDRVRLDAPAGAHHANVMRLLRSLRKWSARRGAALPEADLARLAALAEDA